MSRAWAVRQHGMWWLLSAALVGAVHASPPVIENSLGMRFVHIPAGEFLMGSNESVEGLAQAFPALERGRFTELQDEAPVHRVRLSKPFYLGQHEVTVGQFRRFLTASGHVPESVADGSGGYGYSAEHVRRKQPDQDAFAGRDPRYSWQNPGFRQGDDEPVVNVTWHDAQALARWLSHVEQRTYRLPTEAEWEYACRAGSTTRYPHGDDPEDLTATANVFDATASVHWPMWADRALASRDGHAFTAPVGSRAPNAFGLYDMLGNVWEWTADWHDDDYYARSPGVDPTGPDEGTVRVRRGGSWHTWAFYARCSYRNWNSANTRYTLVGIRLLLEDDAARPTSGATTPHSPAP